MDLVTDFDSLIQKNSEKSLAKLNELYKDVKQDLRKNFYKSINKFYTAMEVWVRQLSQKEIDEENKIILKNILYNYCLILHIVVIGDKKILNFLYRNTIEGFIRYLTGELESRELDSLFSKVNKVESGKCRSTMEIYISRLKQIYDESCLYIHTDTSRMPDDLITLLDLQNKHNEIDLKEEKDTFDKMNLAMINILKIKYYDLYKEFKDNIKSYMDELLTLDDRKRFKVVADIKKNI